MRKMIVGLVCFVLISCGGSSPAPETQDQTQEEQEEQEETPEQEEITCDDAITIVDGYYSLALDPGDCAISEGVLYDASECSDSTYDIQFTWLENEDAVVYNDTTDKPTGTIGFDMADGTHCSASSAESVIYDPKYLLVVTCGDCVMGYLND